MVGLLAVTVSPFVISAIHALAGGWLPTWDIGFIQIRVFDVGTGRTPILGLPSTVSEAVGGEIHHPGPLHFWLLAAPARMFSGLRPALMLAQVTVNMVAAGVAVLAVRSAAGTRAAWWAAGTVLVVAVALGDEALHDPWNPSFALICLLACTACVLALGVRTVRWVMVATVVTASAAAQAHLAGLLQAVTLVAVAAVMVVRRDGWAGSRRSFAWAAGAGVLAWFGPLLDQLVHSPGNVRALMSGTGDTGETYGLVRAFDRFARVVTPPGLLESGLPGREFGGELWLARGGAIVALVAVGVLWWRRRRRAASVALPLLTAVTTASAVLAQAITPITFASFWGRHIWSFLWPAALLAWACVVVVVAETVRLRVPARLADHRALRAAALCMAMLLVVLRVATSPLHEQRDGMWHSLTERVDNAIDVDDLPGRVVIRGEGIAIESELVAGVAADLQRRGVFVLFTGPLSAGLVNGEHYTVSGQADGAATIVFTAGDIEPPDGGQLVFEADSPSAVVESPVRVFLIDA